MSFLAPLYALALAALALPVLFHFLQRRPREQVDFSAVMFLQETPPRLTRRSRLSHLLLLLLRLLVLALLVAAFSRPFLRTIAKLLPEAPMRRVAILVDRSASMQRAGIWEAVNQELHELLDEATDQDRFALFSFADSLRVEHDFEDDGVATRAENLAGVRDALRQVRPGWFDTKLGHALLATVERIQVEAAERPEDRWEVVLITDLQQGADLSMLKKSPWPAEIPLHVRRVAPTSEGNASLQVLPAADGDLPSQLKVRVSNGASSTTTEFRLQWHGDDGEPLADAPAQSLHVPAGRSRVLHVDPVASGCELRLSGDAQPFDNRVYWTVPAARSLSLVYLCAGTEPDAGPFYFLERSQLAVPPLSVVPHLFRPTDPCPEWEQVPLAIVATPPNDAWVAALRAYASAGGHLLIVLDPAEPTWGMHTDISSAPDSSPDAQRAVIDSEPDTATQQGYAQTQLAKLCNVRSLTLERSPRDADAFLTEIDYKNPVFQPFADAKFSDFTKIHVWQTARLMTDHEQPWSVVARWDDRTPALLEQKVDQGTLWILTTGWSTTTSQLALSTKFVPLLASMLQESASISATDYLLRVGDALQPQQLSDAQQLLDPNQQSLAFSAADGEWPIAERPGVYTFTHGDQREALAVNLHASESLLQPLDVAELERLGVSLRTVQQEQTAAERERQMRDVELETRQKLWRWLLAGALGALAVETYYAARLTRKESTHE